MRLLSCVLLAAASLSAQPAESAGVTAAWDVRSQMTALAADVRKIEPLLKQVKPSEWLSQGAPSTYIQQLQSAQNSVQYLIAATDKFAHDPEKLTLAIEAFFQMERMDVLMVSLRDGIRKYQSPDLANMMNQVYAANSVHRDRLRQHIRDLAQTREQEFEIANQEAQRCRGVLSRQAPPERKTERRRTK